MLVNESSKTGGGTGIYLPRSKGIKLKSIE